MNEMQASVFYSIKAHSSSVLLFFYFVLLMMLVPLIDPLFLNHRNCIAFNRLFNSCHVLMFNFVAIYFLDPFLNCNSDMSEGFEVFAE